MEGSAEATVFAGTRRIAAGPLASVAVAAMEAAGGPPVLVFDDATGRVIDLDLRGTAAEVAARHAEKPEPEPAPARGKGRPKLGVVAREVTLLPRHWEWLSAQPGGASAAIRRLVDTARQTTADTDRRRRAAEAAYRAMTALAGDLPGYEAATRALFAADRPAMSDAMAAWPPDIAAYAIRLAFPPEAHPPR